MKPQCDFCNKEFNEEYMMIKCYRRGLQKYIFCSFTCIVLFSMNRGQK